MEYDNLDDPDLMKKFNDNGFIVVKNVVSLMLIEQIRELLNFQLVNYLNVFKNETGIDIMSPGIVDKFFNNNHNDIEWFEKQPRHIQHLIKGEFPLETRLDDLFIQLACEQKIIDIQSVLLSDHRLRMHYPPMVRFKIGGVKQSVVPMHQDAAYFSHLKYFINAWIPISEISEDCGGLNVLKGSHKLGVIESISAPFWGSYCRDSNVANNFEDMHIVIKPGDALFFGPTLLHYTHANNSDKIRLSLDCRWFTAGVNTSRQYLDVNEKKVIQMF